MFIDNRQRAQIKLMANTGGELNYLLCRFPQFSHLSAEQLNEIIGRAMRPNTGEIPLPTAVTRIRREQLLSLKQFQKFLNKEGVAVSFGEEQGRQRRGSFRGAGKRINNQLTQAGQLQRL